MGRATYQHIDNIIIGKGPVCASLTHRNHKTVKVCLKGAVFTPEKSDY